MIKHSTFLAGYMYFIPVLNESDWSLLPITGAFLPYDFVFLGNIPTSGIAIDWK